MPITSSLFEFLFKYRLAIYRDGELTLAAPRTLTILTLVAGLVAIPVIWRYTRIRSDGRVGERRWMRPLLIGLRVVAVALLLLCLLQPALVLSSVVPEENFVGVLVDNSASMTVVDSDAGSRAASVQAALTPEGESFLTQLDERFKVRLFGFASDTQRIASVGELGFAGAESDIGQALRFGADELAGVPLSGLVVLTDGADSGGGGLSEALLSLKSEGVPVYPVGFGTDRFRRDIEISRVEAPRRAVKGSALQVEVTIDQTGFDGQKVALEVIDEGRIASVEEIQFPRTGEALTRTVSFEARDGGPRVFRFRIATQPGEVVEPNNEQAVLIEVVDQPQKILYFEGEPRFEFKFIRRAIAPDENLQLVSMVRMAENRLWRYDVDSGDELSDGFPTTREELFRYRGLVLGSIEASYFTYDQMRMILDFVGRRGGGVLFLGGRYAFSEGGYAGTPVAEVMPVELGPASGGEGEAFFSRLQVAPTAHGRSHPATRLSDLEESSVERWATLPPVSTFNPLQRNKPGAVSLLAGTSDDFRGEQIVLSHHRYGRGRALAFSVHDSWHWQMHASIELEDQTHETFWRQMLRWLASYVPDQIEVTTSRDRTPPDEPVRLIASVRDESFLEVNSAIVTAEISSPSGAIFEVPLEWSVDKDGEFTAEFVPTELGYYEIALDVMVGDRTLGTARTFFEVARSDQEFFGAERQNALLDRLAKETGGRRYTPERLDALVEDLSYSEGGSTVKEYRDLWDMPAIFLALIGLLGAEWIVRRTGGLI